MQKKTYSSDGVIGIFVENLLLLRGEKEFVLKFRSILYNQPLLYLLFISKCESYSVYFVSWSHFRTEATM